MKRQVGFSGALRAALAVVALVMWGCSSTKHVPADEMLLDKVSIDIDGDSRAGTQEELINFLRQTPNHKVLGFAKLQLATYSLSGSDTTKWYNRWLRSLGQPPVIYDEELTEASRRQLRQALINRGYMDAVVTVDTALHPERKRAEVAYVINTGEPHTIGSLDLNIADSAIREIVETDTMLIDLAAGDLFDRNKLDNVRATITERLREHGYYAYSKELITFTADTVRGSKVVDLTLNMSGGVERDSLQTMRGNRVYMVRSVTFVTEEAAADPAMADTVDYRGLQVVYGRDRYIRPSSLYDMCFIEPGRPYNARMVDRTYASLSRLSILRFINIEMRPAGSVGDIGLLDCVISISRNRKQSVSLELEGTNSEGDLGFGIGATYQHRDLTHRSELLTVKFRTAYESLSGNLDGFINKRYSEYAGEAAITFPKFVLPGASRAFKKRMQATTELALSFNYQERPEYTRIIAGVAWRWKWNDRRRDYNRRHTFDLFDINYVRLPRSTIDFIDQIAPDNPLLRYSYEDHFIMRLGYTFYRTNRRIPTPEVNAFVMQPHISTLRASAETAGNLLYALSSAFGTRRDDGAYKVFGIQYAQYIKGEVDYTYTRNLNSRNALAFHVGAGIAYPYGNSSMVPFEKRFYAGGANGVRGWGVRTLGPGCYDARNSVSDFINQCGDIRLDLSVEYRARLFWVFEGALFIDAGNIWTIHDYPNQPGGMFRFNSFYKQIAASYGIGLRMDFTYFLLRFDLGMKAHNPAMNQEPWPLIHPRWGRDSNFHFSVGYPF
ncbi:MAG: BamA/TamA family outer membrane protein [Bacteroidales bacterium]|nr:BamA/TamA family outer membrane protein [Bacteroidales bacterium]